MFLEIADFSVQNPDRLGLLCPILPLIMTGCVNPTPSVEPKFAEQQKQIDELKTDLQSLKFDQDISKMNQVAYLTTGEKGFAALSTELGIITVALDDVQPYANGSRVFLMFGNLTSAAFTNPKAKVDYGPVDAKGSPNNSDEKTKDIDFLKTLPPGQWTRVEVILDGIPPTSLGFVRVHDFANDRISLRR